MLSQSPADETPTQGYTDAWSTAQYLVYHKGGSLSGREWNRSYLNLGAGRFTEISSLTGLDFLGDGRTVATVDWDEDGREDLLLRNRTGPRLQFLYNQAPRTGHWVSISLLGVATHPDAIGARVEVELEGRTLVRTLHAGSGFLGQSSKRLHFGLDQAERIRRLSVIWPDGTRDDHRDLAVDQAYEVKQSAAPQPRPRRAAAGMESAGPSPVEARTGRARRLVLMEKLPLGQLELPSFEQPERKVAKLAGAPVLVNLWGTECAACLAELASFGREREALEATALRIVTLLTDDQNRPRALELLDGFGLRDGAGPATPAFLEALRIYLSSIVGEVGGHQEIPLPTSLLLDPRGQLVAVYLGPVPVEELLEDLRLLRTMDGFNPSETFLVEGIRLSAHRRNWRALSKEFEAAGRADLAEYYLDLHRARPKRGNR